MTQSRRIRKAYEAECATFPRQLVRIALDAPHQLGAGTVRRPDRLIEVWRSRDFLVQVYAEHGGATERLSIQRTRLRPGGQYGDWEDGITWDELQRLKAECGRGDAWAVEVYPADDAVVNVANLRHLWLLPEPPSFAWGAGGQGT